MVEPVKNRICTLDEQANALGLPRSTAWIILKACHKSSGLSAMIIERMLVSPQLPQRARSVIVEYVEEKSYGLYGGSRRQQQRFAVRLFNMYQRMLEGGQAVHADGDVVGTSRIRELERRVRELERLLGHVVTIAPVAGEPGLVAYECPNCRHVTSVLVPTRS
jgi:hypothetical protein